MPANDVFWYFGARYRHIRTGDTYTLEDSEAKFKMPSGEWVDMVVYKNPDTGYRYGRSPQDFMESFEYIGYR